MQKQLFHYWQFGSNFPVLVINLFDVICKLSFFVFSPVSQIFKNKAS